MHPSTHIPDDIFDDIATEQQAYYQKGMSQGLAQANLRDVSQYETDATEFGKQFGRELAAYEEFTQVFLDDHEGKINQKVKKQLQSFRNNLQTLNMQELETVKLERISLAKKFKVILGMLGVKDYLLIEAEEKVMGTDF